MRRQLILVGDQAQAGCVGQRAVFVNLTRETVEDREVVRVIILGGILLDFEVDDGGAEVHLGDRVDG